MSSLMFNTKFITPVGSESYLLTVGYSFLTQLLQGVNWINYVFQITLQDETKLGKSGDWAG